MRCYNNCSIAQICSHIIWYCRKICYTHVYSVKKTYLPSFKTVVRSLTNLGLDRYQFIETIPETNILRNSTTHPIVNILKSMSLTNLQIESEISLIRQVSGIDPKRCAVSALTFHQYHQGVLLLRSTTHYIFSHPWIAVDLYFPPKSSLTVWLKMLLD